MTRRSIIKPVESFTGCPFKDMDKDEHYGLTDRYIRFVQGSNSRRVVISDRGYQGLIISLEREGGRFSGVWITQIQCESKRGISSRKELYQIFINSLKSLGTLSSSNETQPS